VTSNDFSNLRLLPTQFMQLYLRTTHLHTLALQTLTHIFYHYVFSSPP